MTFPSRARFGSVSPRFSLCSLLLSPPATPLTSLLLLSAGDLHAGGSFLALLLPLLFLLGADRGLAVLPGGDRPDPDTPGQETLPVLGMG